MESFEEPQIIKHAVWSSGKIEDTYTDSSIKIIDVKAKKITIINSAGTKIESDVSSDNEEIVKGKEEISFKFRKKHEASKKRIDGYLVIPNDKGLK